MKIMFDSNCLYQKYMKVTDAKVATKASTVEMWNSGVRWTGMFIKSHLNTTRQVKNAELTSNKPIRLCQNEHKESIIM